jgi:hypothetical protein
MAMTPSWTFPTLSFRYDQPISPVTTWFPTVINYQGDASIERKVTEEVASFGKQLGIISEALLEVAGDARHGPKLKRLRTTVDEIEEVKRRQYKSLARQTTASFEELAERDPAEARALIDELRAVAKEAEQRKGKSSKG